MQNLPKVLISLSLLIGVYISSQVLPPNSANGTVIFANVDSSVAAQNQVAVREQIAVKKPDDFVTLRAVPNNSFVQMFDRIAVDATVTVYLSSGSRCTKPSDPTSADIEGMSMNFYKLTCGENTGYVNAQWVDN